MRVLCIIGRFQHDSARRFINEMASQMRHSGVQVEILEGGDGTKYYHQRVSLGNNKFDVVFSINGMLPENVNALQRILGKSKPLYCVYLMDHPIYYYARLSTEYPYVLALSPDRQYVRYIDKYMPNIYATGFLANAGCKSGVEIEWKRRLYDVTFMGSYTDPKKIINGIKAYPPSIADLMKGVAKRMLGCPKMTLESAVRQCLENQNINFTDQEFAEWLSEFRIIDKYVRMEYRDRVIRNLVNGEITIHVFGDGWKNFFIEPEKKKYLIVHSGIDYQDSLSIVSNSKISLNIMPWFKEGAHESVLSAMLCGAVCLTDDSEWLREEFQEEKNIYFYSLRGLRYLPAKIRMILDHADQSSEIAKQGKKLAEEKHTWANRAIEVIDYCSSVLKSIDEEKKWKKYYHEVFVPNLNIVKKIYSVKRCYRKQEFLYAARKMKELTDFIEKMVPSYISWSDKEEEISQLLNENKLLEMLVSLEQTQEAEDYILLSDLLDEMWIPLIIKMQDIYISKVNDSKRYKDKYSIERSQCGAYTMALLTNGEKMYLHSTENPYEEAMDIAQSWFDIDHYDYIVFGLGLGYHVQALLEIDEAVKVVVIEKEAQIIELARKYGQLFNEPFMDRLQIVEDKNYNLFSQVLEQNQKAKVVVHYPSLQGLENNAYRKWIEHYFIEYTSAQTQKVRMNGNFERNIPLVTKEVTELKRVFQGKNVYIIAAGPSLDKNIMELRKIDSKSGIILATGTVLKKLCNEGIIPDFVTIIDGGRSTYEQIRNFKLENIPLLYLPTVYHRILAEYPGDKYVICQEGFKKSEIYAHVHGYPLYQTGGSVTTTALEVAIRLNAKSIIFVGLDLAYTNNQNHAEETQCIKKEQNGNCMVMDIYGEMVPSAKNLEVYHKWIENRIISQDARNIDFIDATEGGAMIKKTKIMSLKQVINKNERLSK